MSIVRTEYRLREANQDDCQLLFEWANDPLVRKNSFNSAVIDWASHQEWFERRIGQPESTRIFILEDEHQTPLGQIRFEREGSYAIIGFSVSADQRKKGLGSVLIQQGGATIAKVWKDVTQLVGKVKPENTASMKVFEKNGYKLIKTESALEYIKEII